MWIVEFRAMMPEERDELENHLGSGSVRMGSVLGAILGAALGIALAGAVPLGVPLGLATTLAGGILGVQAVRVLRGEKRAALDRAIREDLKRGRVQVLHVAPDEVVRLRDSGGLLAGYVAAIGDGQLLFLEPRSWDEDRPSGVQDPEQLFPSRRFSLIRAPRSGVDLGLVPEGELFPPIREIEVAPSDLLKDGEMLGASLALLGPDLRRPSDPLGEDRPLPLLPDAAKALPEPAGIRSVGRASGSGDVIFTPRRSQP